MITQHSRALKFACAFLVLILLAVLASQLSFAQRAAAQANWSIIVDNSINEGAIKGSVSNIQTGTDLVRGNIVVTNDKSLCWYGWWSG